MVRSRQWSEAREYLFAQIARARASGHSYDLARFHQFLAGIEHLAGNRDAALAAFVASEQAEPTSALMRFEHALFLATALEDPERAESKLREAEQLAAQSGDGPPDYASAELYAAKSRFVKGLIHEARARRGKE